MLTPGSVSSHRKLRSSLLLLSAALVPLLAQPACGSDDGKKKAPDKFQAGGEGGEESSGGGQGMGTAAEAGTGGTPTSEAGSAGQATGGAGGSAGIDCPAGSADCDDDPTDCEADVTMLDQCGACGVACSQDNGTTICGETGCEVTSCTEPYHDCNNTGTDGCEATLDTVDNCGFCGHACGEAACTNALCAGTIVGSAGGAYRWAQTSDALYRITGNNPNYGLATNYTLVRIPLDGSPETIMASGNISPGGLTVDDSSVYWALKGTPSAVVKKDHDAAPASGPVPVFETAGTAAPVQLRIQGGDLYWTAEDGAIYKRALVGGTNEPPIVTAAQVAGTGVFNLHQDFVVTPTAMYWVVLPVSGNQAFIRTAPLAGGNASDVAGAITNSFLKLSVSGEDIYWVRATGAALDGVYHYAPGGEVGAPLVVQPNLTAVLQDGDYLYMTGGTFNNQLFRAPVEGGTSIPLGDTSNLTYAMDIGAVSADRIFVITSFTHGAGFFGGLPTVAFPK
jgi:hypothetical protein